MSVRVALVALMLGLAPLTAMAATATVPVGAFDELSVETGISATVTVGPEESVVLEAESDEDFSDVEVSVRNGRLTIRYHRSLLRSFESWLAGGPKVSATVTAPALHEVAASSGSVVTVTGMGGDHIQAEAESGASLEISGVAAGSAALEVESGGRLTIDGTCGRLDARASSGAILDLAGFRCEAAHADAASGGRITLFVTGAINAEATSGGSVAVAGNPAAVETDTASGGRIDVD